MATKIVYTSFDRFPSPKGAATHIGAFSSALGRCFPNVDLVSIPPTPHPQELTDKGSTIVDHSAPGVTHHPIPAEGDHLFERVLNFRARYLQWWQRRFAHTLVPVAHFRSIFEGYPIAQQKSKVCRRIVYEVNGFPSIELKYHYPRVAEDQELLQKLRTQEDICLQAADLILTVSDVNRAYLLSRGVTENKIKVIRNGVDLTTFTYRPPRDLRERSLKLIYTGTLTAWQGVGLAIEALGLYLRDAPATLRIIGPIRSHERKRLEKLIWKAKLADHVVLESAVSQTKLVQAYHEADVALAPLTRSDRNTLQGCCPLKVIEAMAVGTPLVASRLPVVEELVKNEQEALLVRTGSAKAIKDALFRLRNEPSLAHTLSDQARQRVEQQFQWKFAQTALVAAYRPLFSG